MKIINVRLHENDLQKKNDQSCKGIQQLFLKFHSPLSHFIFSYPYVRSIQIQLLYLKVHTVCGMGSVPFYVIFAHEQVSTKHYLDVYEKSFCRAVLLLQIKRFLQYQKEQHAITLKCPISLNFQTFVLPLFVQQIFLLCNIYTFMTEK